MLGTTAFSARTEFSVTTTMPGKQAAEKGAGCDAASTPSNYLTIRDYQFTSAPGTALFFSPASDAARRSFSDS
jgi:hypothetical protein